MNQRSGAIVRNAAKAIEEYGWIQNADGDPEHGMCIRGAIFYVQRDGGTNWGTEEAFSEWMDSNGFYSEMREFWAANDVNLIRAKPGDLTTVWNDWPRRTKEEVLLYMNKFADEMDPQGP